MGEGDTGVFLKQNQDNQKTLTCPKPFGQDCSYDFLIRYLTMYRYGKETLEFDYSWTQTDRGKKENYDGLI